MDDLRPLCFVLMPYGQKDDPSGRTPIDFDAVYARAIHPAIVAAGLEPIRADEERVGGIIHKPMFERLMLCEYAIADLTTANANVFYELGVRHTARPATTLAVFARHQPIPFDVGFLRAIPYDLGPDNAFDDDVASALRETLEARLVELREANRTQQPVDSPVFQLLGEWRVGDLARLKTDVFREQVRVVSRRKDEMAAARALGGDEGVAALRAIEEALGDLDVEEAGIVVDLMLSYRALESWSGMIDLYAKMPHALRRQVLVREQLAFALNRRAGAESRPEDRERALEVLGEVEREQGPSSETCGLIGRIHKDLWDAARRDDPRAARVHLDRAIDAYRRGFEADPRDAFPGINACTLLDVKGDADALRERDRLVPVVRYAVERRLAGKTPDYWDHATMLELAVLALDAADADRRLDDVVAAIRESWEPKSTARNLRFILEARDARGDDVSWLGAIIAELERRGER